ncbi:hypothetical protein BSKO_11572 [Bryopsis sp. KO-2023]|nr:hypothetical protein BSKO_11572 [Bryopsis sp. KO-2023]
MEASQRWATLGSDIVRAFVQHPQLKIHLKQLYQLNRHWRDAIEENVNGWIVKIDELGRDERVAVEGPELPERFGKLWKTLTVVNANLNLLEKLPSLKSLKVRGHDTTSFASLRFTAGNLTHLDLSGCRKIDAIGFWAIGHLTELQTLLLTCTKVSNLDLKQFCSGLPKLEELDLGWCELMGDDGMEHVGSLAEIKCLRLFGTRVTDAGLHFLKDLRKIQELNLGTCGAVTNEGMANLANMRELRKLNLGGTRVDGQGLKCLGHIGNLVVSGVQRI